MLLAYHVFNVLHTCIRLIFSTFNINITYGCTHSFNTASAKAFHSIVYPIQCALCKIVLLTILERDRCTL